MENNIIGKHIKKLRKERGISQRKLSSLSGVTQTNICKIENGTDS